MQNHGLTLFAKLAIVEEEGDEAIYWMELLIEAGVVKAALLASLTDEANQIVSIIVASIKKAKLTKNPKSAFPNPKSK